MNRWSRIIQIISIAIIALINIQTVNAFEMCDEDYNKTIARQEQYQKDVCIGHEMMFSVRNYTLSSAAQSELNYKQALEKCTALYPNALDD